MEELNKRFIISNSITTFLHEMGHALIHDYEIPVLGKEEDACDNFQTYYLIVTKDYKSYYQDNYDYYLKFFHAILEDTADYWFYFHANKMDIHENPFESHSLTTERYNQMISMMYHGNKESFSAYFKKRKIPINLLSESDDSYSLVSSTWQNIYNDNINKKYNGKFILKFENTSEFYEYKKIIEKSEFMNDEILLNNFYFPLKEDIQIIFRDYKNNDVGGGFYNPLSREIVITYNYLKEFDDLYKNYNKGQVFEN